MHGGKPSACAERSNLYTNLTRRLSPKMNRTATTLIPTGQSHERVDGLLKVTGQARYAAEFHLPGLAYAALIQSTIPAGRVEIDTALAERARGVLGVLTPHNMPRLAPPPSDLIGQGQPGEPYVPLQDNVVHWSGQHLAVVIAETFEQAQFAASLVQVQYEAGAPKLDLAEALPEATLPKLWAGREKLQVSRGDAGQALAGAEVTLEETYRTPVQNHNPMELVSTTAFWETPERLLLHDTTRWIKGIQRILAHAFGLAPDDVHVISPFVGGAFGAKGFQWQHIMLAAAAAQLVNRPVRLEFTRREMFTTAGRRAATVQNYALGASAEGRLAALRHETLTSSSPLLEYTEPAGNLSRHLYSCLHVDVSHRLVRLNQPSPCPMRAPGEATGSFALECALDELASRLRLDPIELRLRNYADTDEFEQKPYSAKHLKECYAQGAARFGWSNRTPEPRSMRTADRRLLVGQGMATSSYPANQMPCQATAILFPDGTATVRSATHELGTGTYTAMTQLAAAALGLPVEKVRFELGDSLFPVAPINGGSWLTSSVGPAVLAACAALQEQLAKLAAGHFDSPLTNAKPEDLILTGGSLALAADPARGVPLGAILQRAGRDRLEANGSAKPGENGAEAYAHHSFGAAFAEVTVDPDLGEVRLSRFVGVYDAGRILNPQLARSQFIGGVIFGLSMALHENGRARPAHRPHRERRPRRVPRTRLRRHASRRNRCHLPQRARPAFWRPLGRARHRRTRDRRQRRGDCQRGLSCDRKTGARSSDHCGQVIVLAGGERSPKSRKGVAFRAGLRLFGNVPQNRSRPTGGSLPGQSGTGSRRAILTSIDEFRWRGVRASRRGSPFLGQVGQGCPAPAKLA